MSVRELIRRYALVFTIAVGVGTSGTVFAVPIGDDLTDLFGKPTELMFLYTGTENTLLDTNQAVPAKAEMIFASGVADADGTSFILVSKDSSNPDPSTSFFQGSVAEDEILVALGSFGSNTYLYIFEENGGTLLQHSKYHTSGSAPMHLGDQIGAITLVGFVGENGGSRYLPGYGVPEPATLALMGLGLAGIGYRRHRSKQAV